MIRDGSSNCNQILLLSSITSNSVLFDQFHIIFFLRRKLNKLPVSERVSALRNVKKIKISFLMNSMLTEMRKNDKMLMKMFVIKQPIFRNSCAMRRYKATSSFMTSSKKRSEKRTSENEKKFGISCVKTHWTKLKNVKR